MPARCTQGLPELGETQGIGETRWEPAGHMAVAEETGAGPGAMVAKPPTPTTEALGECY